MLKKILVGFGAIILILFVSINVSAYNESKVEDEVIEEEVVEEYVHEYVGEKEREEILMMYESAYESCIYLIQNDPMTTSLAEEIKNFSEEKYILLSSENIEIEYKQGLIKALTNINLSMDYYLKNEGDKSLDFLGYAEKEYEKYLEK